MKNITIFLNKRLLKEFERVINKSFFLKSRVIHKKMSKNSKILQKIMSFPQKLLKTAHKSAKICTFFLFFRKTVDKNNKVKIRVKILLLINTQDKTEIPNENNNIYLFLLYMLVNIFD